jgi:hypothetical protein
MIDSYDNLKEIFTNNFQSTYVWPDNPWDLKGCRYKPGESLRDYIRRFSQKCHELPKVSNIDVISSFWSGTSYQTLVHELDSDQPKNTKELLDIATQYATGEEVVGVIFVQGDGKMVPDGSQGAPLKAACKGTNRSTKGSKKGQKWHPQ